MVATPQAEFLPVTVQICQILNLYKITFEDTILLSSPIIYISAHLFANLMGLLKKCHLTHFAIKMKSV